MKSDLLNKINNNKTIKGERIYNTKFKALNNSNSNSKH